MSTRPSRPVITRTALALSALAVLAACHKREAPPSNQSPQTGSQRSHGVDAVSMRGIRDHLDSATTQELVATLIREYKLQVQSSDEGSNATVVGSLLLYDKLSEISERLERQNTLLEQLIRNSQAPTLRQGAADETSAGAARSTISGNLLPTLSRAKATR